MSETIQQEEGKLEVPSELIKAEETKGKYGTRHALIQATTAIIVAAIGLFGVYLQVQYKALRADVQALQEQLAGQSDPSSLQTDVQTLQEQVATMRDELSAFQEESKTTLGDVAGLSVGFSQEQDVSGNLIDRYILKLSGSIDCIFGGKYEKFHAILSPKELGDRSGLYLEITSYDMDDRTIKRQYCLLKSDSSNIPINIDLAEVWRVSIVINSSLGNTSSDNDSYIILSDTEVQ